MIELIVANRFNQSDCLYFSVFLLFLPKQFLFYFFSIFDFIQLQFINNFPIPWTKLSTNPMSMVAHNLYIFCGDFYSQFTHNFLCKIYAILTSLQKIEKEKQNTEDRSTEETSDYLLSTAVMRILWISRSVDPTKWFIIITILRVNKMIRFALLS